ncbi:MAG: hypothetical protein EOP04_18230, partial [Proteobacteria bacterium]
MVKRRLLISLSPLLLIQSVAAMMPVAAEHRMCEVYMTTPTSAHAAEMSQLNAHESKLSIQLRKNLDLLGLPTFLMRDSNSAVTSTHVFDFQIALMENYFAQTPQLQTLFSELYRLD